MTCQVRACLSIHNYPKAYTWSDEELCALILLLPLDPDRAVYVPTMQNREYRGKLDRKLGLLNH